MTLTEYFLLEERSQEPPAIRAILRKLTPEERVTLGRYIRDAARLHASIESDWAALRAVAATEKDLPK